MERPTVAPIRFHGSPRLVEGLTSLTLQQAHTASVSLDLNLPPMDKRVEPSSLQTVPIGSSGTRLRFSLPESTPPGTYEGSIQLGRESYSIMVELEPFPYLVMAPRQLSLQVPPGSEAIVDLTVLNSGNVPCQIARAYAFGLFDIEGAERSVGAALAGSVRTGTERLDRLLEEAADNHAGLVRVALRKESGTIEPGESRNLRASLRFSDRLKPGHTYSGTWPLENLRYSVQVSTINPNST